MIDETANKCLQRAKVLIELMRWREAIHELNKYISMFPSDYNALCDLARCHYELNELQKAVDLTRKAVSVEPEIEWAYRLQSLIYRESNDFEKALKCAEICVQKAPLQIYSLQTLAYAQIKKWRLKDAENTVKIMLETSPGDIMTHDVAGFLALKRELWAEAEYHFKQALAIDANNINSLNNLGVVYQNLSAKSNSRQERKKLINQAAECFERAIKVSPTFALAQKNLSAAKSGSSGQTFPIGLGIGLMILFNSLARAGFGALPELISLFTPYSSNRFLLALNFIFLVNLIFWAMFALYVFTYADKEKFTKTSERPMFWLIMFCSQFIPTTAFVSVFFTYDVDSAPFSVLAVIGFSIATFVAFMKLIVVWKNKVVE